MRPKHCIRFHEAKVMRSPLPPPPPPHVRPFRSDDLDEVRSAVRRVDGEHWRVAHGRGPLGFSLTQWTGASVQLAWGVSGLGQTVRGGVHHPALHFPIDQASRYAFGRHAFDVPPGAAVFVAESAEFTRRSAPGAVFAVQLDRKALAAEMAARHPEAAGGWVRHLRRIEADDPRRQALLAALADLAAVTDAPASDARRALCEARVLAAAADLTAAAGSAATPKSALSARRLADLAHWIEAHVAEPLTLGTLCGVAGVGGRALQMAFRSHHGMSPMRFVTERRLAAAHRRLRQRDAGDDVTAIATGAGFFHLGRFSILYREVFGEAPSQTLRRRRAAH
jgi:AraC-like DNA-binding protein